MVKACFSYNGVRRTVFIDVANYCCILSDNFFASADSMNFKTLIFQRKNDPKHTYKLALKFFINKRLFFLDLSAQSSDKKPIENFSSKIIEEVTKKLAKKRTGHMSAIIRV